MDELYNLLRLIGVNGIGNKRILKLVKSLGSLDSVFKASVQEIIDFTGVKYEIASQIRKDTYKRFADKQISEVKKNNFSVLTYWSPDYPDTLKRLFNPPVILFYKGDIQKKDFNSIAVVGMRMPSQYGKRATEYFCKELISYGITIVSGMARGIDSVAHRCSLQNKGRTLAILGSGLDVCYPPENKELFRNIVKSGAVISEFPLHTPPNKENFPRRNRLISAFSKGTLVVEGGIKSGALITAYYALDQGKEVFAVPGKINSKKSKGPHKLIKEGAKLVERVDDILEEISSFESINRSVSSYKDENEILKALSSEEVKLWDVLTSDPIHIDTIAIKAGISTSEALSLLLSMELKDCVKQITGMKFIRN
ncbi:MAG: DNA-processing protein DprA [bacterium]